MSTHWRPEAYGGKLQGTTSPWMGNAADIFKTMGQGGAGPQTQGMPWLTQAGGAWGDLLKTGGMADLTPAMNAIRQQSDISMKDNLAQIREQYGQMGLGAGSDISSALATGASRGTAEMNSQMQQLLTQAWGSAQQNRLGAVGMAPGLAGAAGSPYESWAARQMQGLQGAGMGYMGLAQQDWTQQMQNITNMYSDFQRMQAPSPWMTAAMNYATSNPSQQLPIIGESGMGAGGQIGMSIMSMLPYFGSMITSLLNGRQNTPK